MARMAIEKIKNLGAVLELPAKQHCQNGQNGLNWQCCLAGSFKTDPRILIFSIAMDADYSIELISIETYATQFIGHNKIFLGSVTVLILTSVVFLYFIVSYDFYKVRVHYFLIE